MMTYRMRMLSAHHRRLQALLSSTATEQACFLITSSAVGDGEQILLVREVVPLEDSDFRVKSAERLSVDPKAMLRVARKAEALGGGVCFVHTHPMSTVEVEFSYADDIGNEASFDFFCEMLPDAIHSALVWSADLECVAGRVYKTGYEWDPLDRLDVVGGPVHKVLHKSLASPPVTDPEYDRQARLLGDRGQHIASGLKVPVVGCGGVGSIVAPILGHTGIGVIALADNDIVKKHNRPRQLGSMDQDVSDKALKVDTIARYLKASCPKTTVVALDQKVQARSVKPQLVSADAVVCGTDDTTSRAYLNQLCQQYLIPLLDLGVQFSADPDTGELIADVGKVNLVMPDSPCLVCTGHINSERLRWEGLSEEQRDREVADGYVDRFNVPEPAMMAFNAEVAARGVQVLLGYFTGLIPLVPDEFERFSFLQKHTTGHVRVARKRPVANCPICSREVGVVGLGDSLPLYVKTIDDEVSA